MIQKNANAVIQAIIAAILFGASPPLVKLLLGEIEPIMLAGFLYLGSGIGLIMYRSFKRIMGHESIEAGIRREDVPWLAGSILAGGIAAPIVLMFSLRNTPAATASLLLNFEGVATTLIAFLVFKEAIGRRVGFAVSFITLACIILSWNAGGEWGFSLGALGVLLACVLWGMDNNFTRNISAKDPLAIVTIKGLAAGTFSLTLALFANNSFPNLKIILGAIVLGCFSYGLSIVFFILAMRNLGAARASAFFGTAPFVGAVLSFIFLNEHPALQFYLSFPIMALGAYLLLKEEHDHEHLHEVVEHEHRHCHNDGHHTHYHPGQSNVEHSHWHVHEAIRHTHPHTPDLQHRHEH